MGLGEVLEKWKEHSSYNFDDAVEFVGYALVMGNIPEIKYDEYTIKNDNGNISVADKEAEVMKVEGNRISYVNAEKYNDGTDFKVNDLLTGIKHGKKDVGLEITNGEFTVNSDGKDSRISDKNLTLNENLQPVGITPNLNNWEYNNIAEALYGNSNTENILKSKETINEFCKKIYENMIAGQISQESVEKIMNFFRYSTTGGILVKAILEKPDEVMKNANELEHLERSVLNTVHYDTREKMKKFGSSELIEMAQIFYHLKGHDSLITKRRGFIIGKYLKGEHIKPTLLLKWKING